jgi:Mrp family chromosome partitioning ATPase
VIRLVFQHLDPEIAQAVLQGIIDAYFKKHVEIHRGIGVFDNFLTQQTDQMRSRLAQTEKELREAQEKAGVISLEESRKMNAEQMAKLRQDLLSAEVELAERIAGLAQLTESELVSAAQDETPAVVPGRTTDEYRNLNEHIDFLWKKKQALLTEFTDDNVRVKKVGDQIAEASLRKREMETEFPQLINLPSREDKVQKVQESLIESARVAALESKIKVLNSQLNQVRNETSNMLAMEPTIDELQRKRDLEESNYRHFLASSEQSRINEALGSGKVSNINPIQSPSPAFRSLNKLLKILALVVFGGIFMGFAWAFLIELVFDGSVKRPIEVERKLGLNLFLSIPDISHKGHRKLAATATNARSNGNEPQSVESGLSDKNFETLPGNRNGDSWSCHSVLHTFYEALRDRLVVYFEVRNYFHKPKLIAVTGASKGSGVTLTAVGLASSLSETGDGNVLLVDMHPEREAAQHFYRGKPICELDYALSTKDRALVQENLYVVTGGSIGDKLSQIYPKRFTNLVPKLKASDYDYIIFDMPPVTQTSVTPRLAGCMDMVLFVIEAEKTDREIVRQASSLLGQSNANVCAVLNKTRNYVPSWLHQEFLSES